MMPDLATICQRVPSVWRTLFDKVFGQIALGTECRALERERVFGLRVKGRIFDKRIDKDPHVILDLERLDWRRLVFLFNLVHSAVSRAPSITHSLLASCVVIMSTCVPPLMVEIEFANETCWVWPSDKAKATSQRLLTTS
jgi:hypothetical protein